MNSALKYIFMSLIVLFALSSCLSASFDSLLGDEVKSSSVDNSLESDGQSSHFDNSIGNDGTPSSNIQHKEAGRAESSQKTGNIEEEDRSPKWSFQDVLPTELPDEIYMQLADPIMSDIHKWNGNSGEHLGQLAERTYLDPIIHVNSHYIFLYAARWSGRIHFKLSGPGG